MDDKSELDLVQHTDNGWHEGDPVSQPEQDIDSTLEQIAQATESSDA